MKQENMHGGGLWSLLKHFVESWFGPIERSKYRWRGYPLQYCAAAGMCALHCKAPAVPQGPFCI